MPLFHNSVVNNPPQKKQIKMVYELYGLTEGGEDSEGGIEYKFINCDITAVQIIGYVDKSDQKNLHLGIKSKKMK